MKEAICIWLVSFCPATETPVVVTDHTINPVIIIEPGTVQGEYGLPYFIEISRRAKAALKDEHE